MTDSTWTIASYQGGDEEAATALYNEIFKTPITVEQYRWKLLQPVLSGNVATVWLAKTGTRLIGQFAGRALRFKLGGETLSIVQGCDAMTAQDTRRRGVLSAVGRAAMDAWGDAGTPFMIGLENEEWGSRRAFLDLRPQFRLDWLVFPLRPERIVAAVSRHGVTSRLVGWAGALAHGAVDLGLAVGADGVEVSEMGPIGSEFDALWERLGGLYEALVVRDAAWLRYRYREAPEGEYAILLARRDGREVGYVVYRRPDSRGRGAAFADLFVAPSDGAAARALLRAGLRDLRRLGAASARVLVPRGTRVARWFRRAGFLVPRGSYNVVVIPLAWHDPHPILADPARWFTISGDYDVV